DWSPRSCDPVSARLLRIAHRGGGAAHPQFYRPQGADAHRVAVEDALDPGPPFARSVPRRDRRLSAHSPPANRAPLALSQSRGAAGSAVQVRGGPGVSQPRRSQWAADLAVLGALSAPRIRPPALSTGR